MNKAFYVDKQSPAAREGVPEGERARLAVQRRRSRRRVVRRAFRRRPPPARRRRRADARRAAARRRRVLVLGLHADEDDAARDRARRRGARALRACAPASSTPRRLRLARRRRRARRLLAGRVARRAALRARPRRRRRRPAGRRRASATRELPYDRLVIATGSSPVDPADPGLEELDYWTNNEATETTEVPGALLVLGGGPVGCELAQFFARVGSKVTLVQAADRLLPRVDAEAAALVQAALEEDGVEVRLGARVEAVEGDSCPRRGAARFDRLLVATGRRPNVDGLERARPHDHASAGSRSTSACAPPRTSGRSATSPGSRSSRTSASTTRGSPPTTSPAVTVRADHRAIPATIFTDPQVATVGHARRPRSRRWELTSTPRLSTYERPKRDGLRQGRRRSRTARRSRAPSRSGPRPASGCSSSRSRSAPRCRSRCSST